LKLLDLKSVASPVQELCEISEFNPLPPNKIAPIAAEVERAKEHIRNLEAEIQGTKLKRNDWRALQSKPTVASKAVLLKRY
jgi:hypothetical protein